MTDRPLPTSDRTVDRTVDRTERLTRVLDSARRAGVDALVLSSGPDLHYVLGDPVPSHERLSALVVGAGARGDRRSAGVFVVPELEATARLRALAADLGVRVETWRDGTDPVGLVRDELVDGTISGGVPGAQPPAVVAVSAALPAAHLLPLQSAVRAEYRSAAEVVDPVRAAKDAGEIAELAAAARGIDAVHARVPGFLRAGRTEREVAADITRVILAAGLEGPEFVIVASGENGADPHHDVSDRALHEGDLVVVDIGGPVPSGYHSDCTRTFVVGEPPADAAVAYAALEAAQAAARATVRPGVAIGAVDAAARDALTAAGYGELFTHRTGHGIGLGLHEAPFAAPGATDVLAEGMTFTVEPGVYLAGRWGMRLEDVVVVTADGGRSLNSADRSLMRATG